MLWVHTLKFKLFKKREILLIAVIEWNLAGGDGLWRSMRSPQTRERIYSLNNPMFIRPIYFKLSKHYRRTCSWPQDTSPAVSKHLHLFAQLLCKNIFNLQIPANHKKLKPCLSDSFWEHIHFLSKKSTSEPKERRWTCVLSFCFGEWKGGDHKQK